jgi:hypothetical protein
LRPTSLINTKNWKHGEGNEKKIIVWQKKKDWVNEHIGFHSNNSSKRKALNDVANSWCPNSWLWIVKSAHLTLVFTNPPNIDISYVPKLATQDIR